jgi:PAS domain S-box-containing protein
MSHPWTYTSFTEPAGLAGQFVFDLTFDFEGRLWVASAGGLLSFDGLTWVHYGQEDGLPSTFIRSVLADDSGQIWVGTDRGLAVGDIRGFAMSRFQPSAANIRRLRRGPDGAVWICSDSWLRPDEAGGLAVLGAESLSSIPVPDNYVSDVRFLGDDTFLLTNSGVLRRTGDGWTPVGNSDELGYPRDLALSRQGTLMLSTALGLYALKDGVWRDSSLGLEDATFHHFVQDEGGLTVVDRDARELKSWNGVSWVLAADLGGHLGIPESVAQAPDGARWFVASGLLARFGPSRSWIQHPELNGRPVEDTAERLWFETAEGVFRLDGGMWTLFLPGPRSVVSREQDVTWIWSAGELVRIDVAGSTQRFSAASLGLPQGIHWFDTNSSGNAVAYGPDGLITRTGSAWSQPEEMPLEAISDLTLDESGVTWMAEEVAPMESVRVLRIDGDLRELTRAPPVSSLTQSRFLVKTNPMLLGGDFDTARFVDGAWGLVLDLPTRSVAGWYRSGSREWIAHDSRYGGVSGVTVYSDGVPSTHPIAPVTQTGHSTSYGNSDELVALDSTGHGIVYRVRSPSPDVTWFLRRKNGDFWAASSFSAYHLSFSEERPETVLTLQARSLLEGDRLNLSVDSQIPWGAGRGKPHQFSWRLNDGPWSVFETTEALSLNVSSLGQGSHFVEVRSRSVFGIEDATPARASFVVVPTPLQERPWFWPLVLLVLGITTVTSLVALGSKREISTLNAALEERVQRRTEALEETRTRLAAIVLASPAPILVISKGAIVEVCNPAGGNLLGRVTGDIIGEPITAFVDPTSASEFREIIREVRAGESVNDRLISPRLENGEQVHIALSAVSLSPVPSSDQVLLLGVEITARVNAQAELKKLSLELQRVQELERRRLAQDLHDDVGGTLTTLKMALLMDLHQDTPVEKPALQERIGLVQGLMDRIRTVSLLLRPSTLDDFGLTAAVRTLVKQIDSVSSSDVHLMDGLDAETPLSEDLSTAAYRIIQESLTNISRHAGASNVQVTLWQEGDTLRLRVRDDGSGFDPSTLLLPLESSGLSGMKRRAEVLGGRLEIQTSPEGTVIDAALPMEQHAADVEEHWFA